MLSGFRAAHRAVIVFFFCLATVVLVACGDDESSDFVSSNQTIGNVDPDSLSEDNSSSSTRSSSSQGENGSSSETSGNSSSDGYGSSSSSIYIFSSSSVGDHYVPPCRNDEIDTCLYGVLTDKRDGNSYKTVVIGTQVWMAENLNYETADDLSYCFFKDNCKTMGRFYEWPAAMDTLNTGYGTTVESCPLTLPVQGACPAGWHIPSEDEWEYLYESVGLYSGVMLKSTTGWDEDADSTKGINAYGFNAYPMGHLYKGSWNNKTSSVYYWPTSNEYCGVNLAYGFSHDKVRGGYDILSFVISYKVGKPIRCLRDEPYSGTLVSDEVSTTRPKLHPIDYYLNPNVEYGEMKDERDGHVYKTVEIDGQVWMAQNLNYKPSSGRSSCLDGDEAFCEIYGRLYSPGTAIDSANLNGTYSSDSLYRGVCPAGWHIPSINEILTLALPLSTDTAYSYGTTYFYGMASKLMSKKQWFNRDDITNETGLSLLPNIRGSTSLMTAERFTNSARMSTVLSIESEWVNSARLETKMDKDVVVRCVKDGSPIRFPTRMAMVDSCRIGGADHCQYGSLKDKRDGRTYKTVVIGHQEWMAENLKYADSAKTPSLKHRTSCPEGEEELCEKYGRLYSWLAAMDSARYYTSPEDSICGCDFICEVSREHQGICPDGWRLPSIVDFQILMKMTDGAVTLANEEEWSPSLVPDSLMANTYGFNLLPTEWEGNVGTTGKATALWSNSVDHSLQNRNIFSAEFSALGKGPIYWTYSGSAECRDQLAIRCIKE